MRHILKFANLYKPIDDSPSGLLEILIMSLSPFKRKISLLVQDTDTMSPYPSKPPIKAYKRVNTERNYWHQINMLFGQDNALNKSIYRNLINIRTYRIKILSYENRKHKKRTRTALFNHDVAHFYTNFNSTGLSIFSIQTSSNQLLKQYKIWWQRRATIQI